MRRVSDLAPGDRIFDIDMLEDAYFLGIMGIGRDASIGCFVDVDTGACIFPLKLTDEVYTSKLEYGRHQPDTETN